MYFIFSDIYKAAKSTQGLYKDISCKGPTCALLQGASENHIQQLTTVLLNSDFKFSSSYTIQLQLLQKEFPLLFSYMMKTKVGESIPASIRALLLSILQRSQASFATPSQHTYEPPEEEELLKETHFFPNLPRLHRLVKEFHFTYYVIFSINLFELYFVSFRKQP